MIQGLVHKDIHELINNILNGNSFVHDPAFISYRTFIVIEKVIWIREK